MRADRWEYGSDFHLPDPAWLGGGTPAPWDGRPCARLRTGRHALVAAVRALVRSGTTRLWVPSYFCQEVLAPLAAVLPLAAYDDAPDGPAPDLARLAYASGDAVLAYAPFGLRAPARGAPAHVPVIEDHTHDPFSAWASGSRATYAIASLRKSLPVPDGATWWSPVGAPVDAVPHAEAGEAVLDRLAGMALKSDYLDGAAVEKDAFRARLLAGEAAIADGDPAHAPMSGYTLAVTAALDAGAWRDARRAGHAAFRAALDGLRGARVWAPASAQAAPFAAVVTLDAPERRDAVRAALVKERVYPAVLWSLDAPVVAGIPDAHVRLARASFALPVDARYAAADVTRAAALVRAAVESAA